MARIRVDREVNRELLIEQLEGHFPNKLFYLEIVDGQLYLTEATETLTVEQLNTILAAHAAADKSTRQANFDRVAQIAQSAVGVAMQDLTATQIKALLAVLLFQAGAFDAQGRVRPLGQWV